MKTRTLRIVLGLLACLALLAAFSTSGAQAPTSPPPPQYGGEEPEFQEAPLRPGALEPPPPGTGFVPPPMDLSHLTGQRMPSGVGTQVLLDTWDWRAQGKVTPAKDQGGCGACYAFAAVGNVEAKMLVDGAGTFDFSENNAKECNYRQTSCAGGNFYDVANLFSQKGTVLESCDPYVPSNVPCESGCPYQKTLLDWHIISDDAVADTAVLKQYIHTYGPVYTAMYAGSEALPGAYGLQGPQDAWGNELSLYDGSYTLYYGGTEDPNHAVLIVGWNDDLPHDGGTGGWIVKNSWGTSWGDNGFFYIAYGSARIGTSSSFVHTWQDYDTNGGIMYYDEGGMTYAMGCGSTTAWGLVRFIPTSNTNVTRVEFWTMDTTTDVDVYIYDDFDGTTLSNLLASKENLSFNEAGYHSVQLDSPVAVTSEDDVIAVAKFTNNSYTFPVPVDSSSPTVTGRTYVRCTEISPWSDMGVDWSRDVAIRLRTSTGSGAPDVSITTRVIGSDFSAGDPVTITLSIGNSGTISATGVVVTDTLSSDIWQPSWDRSPSLAGTTARAGTTYVWDLPDLAAGASGGLAAGASGVITIYGTISSTYQGGFWNTASISASNAETNTSDNSDAALVGGHRIYLPLVIRNS